MMAPAHEVDDRRRVRTNPALDVLTSRGRPIAFAMIDAAMGLYFDFEENAVGGAGDFLERFATLRTTALILGQIAGLVARGKMIVIASSVPGASRLLSARPGRGS